MQRDKGREEAIKRMYGKDLEIYTTLNNPNVNEVTIAEIRFITPTKNEYKLTEYLWGGLTTHLILKYKTKDGKGEVRDFERLFHDPILAEYIMMSLISEE